MEGKQDDLMINNNLCRRLHIGSLIQHIFMFCPFSIVIMLMIWRDMTEFVLDKPKEHCYSLANE